MGWSGMLNHNAVYFGTPNGRSAAALEHLAGDPGSVVAGQEEHRFGDVLGLADSPQGSLRDHLIEHRLVHSAIGHIRLGQSGGDGVVPSSTSGERMDQV